MKKGTRDGFNFLDSLQQDTRALKKVQKHAEGVLNAYMRDLLKNSPKYVRWLRIVFVAPPVSPYGELLLRVEDDVGMRYHGAEDELWSYEALFRGRFKSGDWKRYTRDGKRYRSKR